MKQWCNKSNNNVMKTIRIVMAILILIIMIIIILR